jgi:hypothetical protein
MSGNFLDTCLDYSLTIYVMQRTASVAGFADPTQLKCHDDWRGGCDANQPRSVTYVIA